MKVALCLSGQPRVVEVGFQKLNETIFKSYQDAINNRMKAGHDVSKLTKRLNTLIATHTR